MHLHFVPLRALACALALASTFARAQSALPPERVPLDSLAAFRPTAANWKIAGDLAGDPRRDKTLTATEGTGVLVCQATTEARGQLFTTWEHGDLEVDLEFLMLPGADSGLYFQGRYELQVRDSWGKAAATASDNGGLLPAYDESKPAAERNTGGSAPKANASRAPGLWQRLHVEFEAPRFDASGTKTRNARFVRVLLNGFTIQENVECLGATRGGAFKDEAALGPLMIQGNNLLPGHAIRRLAVKRFTGEKISTADLRYKLYAGNYTAVGAYDTETPKAEGALEHFSHAAVEKTGRFALAISGTLTVPRAGAYRFSTETSGPSRLLIDSQPAVTPLDRSGAAGIVTLAAGPHAFRLDLVQGGPMRPTLELTAEGPGIAPHALTVPEENAAPKSAATKKGGRGGRKSAPTKKLVVEPTDRVLVQRGFVPFDPRKRLYALSVGSPAGAHFAYDSETGTVLRAWRGSFLDTYAMWENRGNDQTAVANGPALTFHGKPTLALIENAATGDWPEQADALWTARGYTLDADGTPTFLGKLSDIDVRDRLVASANGRGLTRTIELKGKLPSWSTWVLLAESAAIAPQPGGGWVIGEREWFLDWPAGAAHQPVVRYV
ncbi:MAG: hypothetical protein RLZZ15_2631, partial [Verrucomicrobiota bacterium]